MPEIARSASGIHAEPRLGRVVKRDEYTPSQDSQQSVHTIKAIVGEKPGEYLIDWADNRFTGQVYSPDWTKNIDDERHHVIIRAEALAQQPKHNVNKEAIADWENRKTARYSKKSSKGRRRNRTSSLSVTIHCSVSHRPEKRRRRIANHNTRTRISYQSIEHCRDLSSTVSSGPGVTVLVSQHSSLDREQYILYQSSLSLSATSYTQHPDSALGSLSPERATVDSQGSLVEKVVPDSQTNWPPSNQSHSTSPLALSESVPCTPEILELDSNHEDQFRGLADLSRSRAPVRQGQALVDPGLLVRVPSVASCGKRNLVFKALRNPKPLIVESEQSFQRATCSLQRPESQNRARDINSTGSGSSYRHRERSPTSRHSYSGQVRRTSNFVISENLEDEASTTQDTTDSPVLSQLDTSSQSHLILLARDLSTEDDMSEIDLSRSPGLAHQASPDQGGQGKGKFREKLKQMRAASRTQDSVSAPSPSQQTLHSPIRGSFASQEAAPSVRTSERRSSHNRVQSALASSQNPAMPRNPPPPMNNEPVRMNVISQPSIPQQQPFPPQPQAYFNQEQQSRFNVRPMALPLDVPLAVRTTHHGPPPAIPQNHVPYHSEPPYVPKTTSLRPCGLGVNEHTIGLAMHARVRDQYTSTINFYQKSVEDFMSSEMPEEATVQKVKELLLRINHITTHLDLDAGDIPNESQASQEVIATWAEECSFKFKFLNHLFKHMRDDAAHVSIVARPGRTLDIISTFLSGRHIFYFRPDGRGSSNPHNPRSRVEVSIVPSGPEGMNLAVKPAALVIAFDGSFNVHDPQVLRMRKQPGIAWMMPAIHLLVFKSAEHIARCIDPQQDEVTRLKRITSCMTQLRHDVGVLPPEDMPVGAAAEEVAIAIRLDGHHLKWSLPSIRAIPLDFIESSQEPSTLDGSQSSDQDAPVRNSRHKRVWDPESSNAEAAKRQRMSPAGNVSHVSDSATQSTNAQIDHLQRQNAYLTRQNDSLRTQLEQLSNSLASLKENLTTTNRTNRSLSSQLSHHTTQESHLSDLEASLSELQTRYETKVRSHAHVQIEKTDLLAALEKANKKIDMQSAEITLLKDTRTVLETNLEQARRDLVQSSNPDMARLATSEATAQAAQKEVSTHATKISSLNSDLQFARQAYQEASTSAAELAAQVQTLTSQLDSAEQKAKGEAARLALVNKDTAVKEAKQQVRQLKIALEERDKVCRRKEEEIETLKGRRGRGGVVTRGGSVQPGVGQGKSPRGSRGGSPMPGISAQSLGGEGMRRGGSGLRGEVVG
ncbi:MAG: hypothetical protein Q9208_001160 [Pyrenodesmia sp. 3 TL-2023]